MQKICCSIPQRALYGEKIQRNESNSTCPEEAEQVILGKQYMNHPEALKDYFGGNLLLSSELGWREVEDEVLKWSISLKFWVNK